MDSITIPEIADLLQKRGSKRLSLFLGAKAGAFYDNKDFYEQIQKYSTRPTFPNLSSEEKFQDCYWTLENFSERDRDSMLSLTLGTQLIYRREDDYLAELLKANLFDVVISTNIDVILEDALKRERVKEARSYELLTYEGKGTLTVKADQRNLVIKLFGDFESSSDTSCRAHAGIPTLCSTIISFAVSFLP